MNETLTTKHQLEATKELKIVHFGQAMAKKMAYSCHERLIVT